MGMMAFQLPPNRSAETDAELERACVAGGQDGMPFPTQVTVDSQLLSVKREAEESGSLQAPWRLDGVGRVMFSTGTLMEREKPYDFLLELARGKIHQLRNQTSDWLQGGLILHESLERKIQEATHAFGKAASLPPGTEATRQAESVLTLGVAAAQELVRAYAEQVFQVRHLRQSRLDTLWGCQWTAMPDAAMLETLKATFNTVKLPICWNQLEPREGDWQWDALDHLVEEASKHFTVIGGPLVHFAGCGVADWIWPTEPDINSLSDHINRFTEKVVRRYRDKIRVWQATAAGNWPGVLSSNDEELLWLTVRIVETMRQVAPDAEIIIGLAQPWGEYRVNQERDVTPFTYIDTLLRTGMRIDGVDLEVVMGVDPRGTYCRDPLDLSRLLDLFVLLGANLHVTLGYPSASTPDDAQADPDLRPRGGEWGDGFTPADQADWARAFAQIALCKPYVRGVTWTHADDRAPHLFPHCGLFDLAGRPKPVLEPLRQMRVEHLK